MALQSHNQSNEANCSADMEVCTYELDCSIGPSGLVLNSKLSPYRSRSSIFFQRLCVMSWRGCNLVPRAHSCPIDDNLLRPVENSHLRTNRRIDQCRNIPTIVLMSPYRSRSSIFFRPLCVALGCNLVPRARSSPTYHLFARNPSTQFEHAVSDCRLNSAV